MRRERFRQRLAAKAALNTIDEDYAHACFLIEKKLGVEITPEYPAIKFAAQLQEMRKYYKNQDKKTTGLRGKKSIR